MNLQSQIAHETRKLLARRWFFRECGVGLGSIALGSMLAPRGLAASAATGIPGAPGSSLTSAKPANPLAPRQPHFAPRAKRVIYLFMAGAPSHLDLFDHKPELAKRNGQLPPPSLLKNYRAAFINPNSALLGPKYKFARHGKSGAELSELLPHTARVADDICIVRSMQTDAVN